MGNLNPLNGSLSSSKADLITAIENKIIVDGYKVNLQIEYGGFNVPFESNVEKSMHISFKNSFAKGCFMVIPLLSTTASGYYFVTLDTFDRFGFSVKYKCTVAGATSLWSNYIAFGF